jgi:lipoate-protein ligase A
MNWKFVDTGFNTGKFNMDFDLNLVSRLRTNEAILRFYRWKPYCISLGANQPFDSVNLKKANQAEIDIVKRPTGGRAILHAEELTYSVIHPITSELSPKILYREINLALKIGLGIYHPALQKLSLENIQPHFPSFYKETKSSLCFAVTAKSEINFEGKKLVGSAQRKIGNAVLQHGSILCGTFHKKLIDYLKLSMEERADLEKEIDSTTTQLETILNSKTDYDKLTVCLKSGFENHFNISIEANKESVIVN